jgi:hypothetical protein
MRLTRSFAMLAGAGLVVTLVGGGLRPEAAQADPPAETIYVNAATGSDTTGDGTAAHPFATITAARDLIRTYSTQTDDIEVLIAPGVYYNAQAITFGPQDSGTGGYQITYKKDPAINGEVRVVGGVPITGWTSEGNGIYSADISTIPDFWALYDNREKKQNAQSSGTSVGTVADASHLVRRYAGEWFGEIVKANADGSIPVGVAGQSMSASYYYGAKEYIDQDGEWAIEGTKVYYQPGYDPSMHEVVAGTATNVFAFVGGGDTDLNVFQTVADSDLVKNITIEGLTIEMNNFGPNLFAHSGRRNASVDGSVPNNAGSSSEMNFNVQGLVHLANAENITVKDNKIQNAGYVNVALVNHAQQNLIYGNYIKNAGYTNVMMIGDNPGSTIFHNKNNTIENNVIQTSGLAGITQGAGMYLINSGDNLITHNDISDASRYGISLKGLRLGVASAAHTSEGANGITPAATLDTIYNYDLAGGNQITYNRIYNTGKTGADGGCIETWGGGRDNVIDHNILYTIYQGSATTGWRGHAVFLDDGGNYFTITNNIIFDTRYPAANASMMMKGLGNVAYNNVFDVTYYWDGSSNTDPYIEAAGNQSYSHNIVYSDSVPYNGEPNDVMWKISDGGYTSTAAMDYNLYWTKTGAPAFVHGGAWKTFAEWQDNAKGFDAHAQVADPLFTDVANHDYKLTVDSPAWALGTKSIEASTIGLKADYAYGDAADPVQTLYLVGEDGTDVMKAVEGGRYQVVARARTATGYLIDDLGSAATYSSDNPAVATVDADGLVTYVDDGVATITATYQGKTAVFTIYAGAISAKVTTSSDTMKLHPNDLADLGALVYTNYDQLVTSPLIYTSADPSVATVDEDGIVKGIGIGTTTITAALAADPAIAKTVTVKVSIAVATVLDVTMNESGPVDSNGHTFSYLGSTAAATAAFDRMVGQTVQFTSRYGNGGYYTMLTDADREAVSASFTAEQYMYLTAFSGAYGNAWGAQESGGYGIDINSSGKLEVYAPMDGGSTGSRLTYQVSEWDAWYDVVVTYDGATLSLYVNGELVASSPWSGTYRWPSGATCTETWFLGSDCGGGPSATQTMNGAFAAGRLYAGALTDDQVADLYELRIRMGIKPAVASFAALNETDYTTSTWAGLEDLNNAIKALTDAATKVDIEDAINAYYDKVDALEKRGDTSYLNAVATVGTALDASPFTDASAKAFQDALAAAKAIVADNSDSNQAAVDAALADLKAAFGALTPKPVPTVTVTPTPSQTATPTPAPTGAATKTATPSPTSPKGYVTKYESFVLSPDLSGDGRGEILAVAKTGALDMYSTSASGTITASKTLVPSGEAGKRIFGPGDWNTDGANDIVSVDKSGNMFLRIGYGNGGVALQTQQIGHGWAPFRIIPAGDLTSDGFNDMLAIDAQGRLWLYAGNGKGGWLGLPKQVGQGWVGLELYAAGDLNGDGNNDILAILPDGTLWAYNGRGNGTFSTPKQVGRGWGAFELAAGADLNGDGLADIVGRNNSTGELFYYQGNGGGSFQGARKIAEGW